MSAEDQRRIALAEQAVAFARGMLEPGRAVILDVETASMPGPICEIAVIDAASGLTLLDTLVNPGVAIDPAAYAVHGIGDSEVTAPGIAAWPTVFGQLCQVVAGRKLLAYNADFDRDMIWADCQRYGIADPWVMDAGNWADVMVPRSHHRYQTWFLKNEGGHRAAGDVAATRQHLLEMTEPAPWPR
ncbi:MULTISPECIES: 3'-5' exonuclease [Mycolicibacter]|uniref:3'-5' exonuclease n=2 Tax=Mycolicibacter TaxID=1073531 RepID=A0ABU5XLR4_9MYCO|nr:MULTISPECIES: 3'-5' exonuclease [unclassified Mycolicibacter]MEB3022934.1 3'-5' exonuclease [Mycolicibacter sp. MYC098]MEB3035079.1 3'-5' exonuclease [Mycolicibacter sp. MYC340]